jgi:hypothetical protein
MLLAKTNLLSLALPCRPVRSGWNLMNAHGADILPMALGNYALQQLQQQNPSTNRIPDPSNSHIKYWEIMLMGALPVSRSSTNVLHITI